MKLEINLNDNISVRLTDFGYEVWSAHIAAYAFDKVSSDIAQLKGRENLDGMQKFQLHYFIRIFGAHIGFGTNLVIENNNILIK